MMKDETTCIRCAMCASRCPTHAILMKHFDFHRECVTVPAPKPQGAPCRDAASTIPRHRACAPTCGRSGLSIQCSSDVLPAEPHASNSASSSSLGLVSSLHCVQMCGPIVLAYSLPVAAARSPARPPPYNAGRIAHLRRPGRRWPAPLGGGIGLLGRLAGLATGARVFAGAAMIVAGILMIGLVPSNGLVTIQNRRRHQTLLATRRPDACSAPEGKFTLGLILGFLPCGLVYAALLKAMDSGSALAGALTMLAFGAGTAVALLAIGAASSFVDASRPLEQSPRRRLRCCLPEPSWSGAA